MRVVLRVTLFLAVALVAYATEVAAQTGLANMVDHIHLAVPDPAKGVEWYRKHFNGQPMTEAPDRLMFGETRVIFQKNESPQPSSGSVVDHIGFSVKDLDAALKDVQADGGKLVTPARDVEGLFRLAFVEDPWGVRIEVVQDPAKLGLHHIHLRAADPAVALAWYVDKIGGTLEKLKGRIDGINYGGVWLLAQRGETTPSPGHAIDHIGFRPLNVDSVIAGMKAKNVKVTTEPRPLTLAGGTTMRLAFIDGPDGVRIELVQRS
jgi:catechol 2,3-dioxygenase-like lactoylglutathione lyase family enzyme